MKELETYTDYRKFLADYYAERKNQNPHYSFRTFCQLAKISSPSLFKEVVDGKHNLSKQTTDAFIRGLKLKERQAKFFMALVNFNQAKTDKEKQFCLEQMQALRPLVNQKLVPANHYEYYSRWYHSAVRELACTLDWKEDYALLARTLKPKIKTSEARKSVELLLALGFLEKGAGGHYSQKDSDITTGKEVHSLAVRKLNHTLAGLGQVAAEECPPDERHISSIILGVSKESREKIIQEIREFRQKVVAIVHEDKTTDQVCNLNIQLFPLSERYSNKTIASNKDGGI